MKAEILSTGDELRTGQVVDSNSAYISRRLEAEGITVVRHRCVGDALEAIAEALQSIAAGGCRLALVSGGLGPTEDDLTAAAAARAAGVDLATDPEALHQIEAMFARLGRPVSASNRKQARLPAGASCLANPVGTAPGFELALGQCRFFFMPGVPSEMRRMLSDEVLPRIRRLIGTGQRFHLSRTLSCFGLPESTVGDRLSAITVEHPLVQLGLRARFPEIQVKLYAQGPEREPLESGLDAAADWTAEQLGGTVFSRSGRPMAEVVGRLLHQASSTVAVAESCTGGLIGSWLTDVSGSSEYFLLSAVTYANDAKCKLLGVPPAHLESHGAVDDTTARLMAVGARKLAGADYAVATSGIAGPSGGSPEKPVGTVCIGLASPRGSWGRRYRFPFGDRRMKKQMFAMAALDALRRELTGAPHNLPAMVSDAESKDPNQPV